jgi:hypothetical protein
LRKLLIELCSADILLEALVASDIAKNAPQDSLDQFLKFTKRSCVVYQTLRSGPPLAVRLQRS